jgi:hypothetical protein
MNKYRRQLLLCTAGLLAATAPQAPRAQIPSNQVNLADFGGVPGASATVIISAFHQAFDLLKSLGGGLLTIPPGTYDLGTYAEGIYVIGVRDLQNVELSGYGATLEMRTAARTTTVFFSFLNPSNVTVRGLSFYDHGTDLSVNWQGAVCLDVLTTRPCSGFRTVDCTADHVVSFFRSLASGDEKYKLTGCDLHATVKNSYYGVNMRNNGNFSRCDINCIAVRRGFIGYGMKDWTIAMRCHSTDEAGGSNGFISFIAFTGESSENCETSLTVTGSTSSYSALVHYYHQAEGESEFFRNMKADVRLDNPMGAATVFLFDHALESGVIARTQRTFDKIVLTGTVVGTYTGKIIENPSISIGTPNDIAISSDFTGGLNMSELPSYVRTFDRV